MSQIDYTSLPPRLCIAFEPTVALHIETLHAALFHWALARSLDGDLILRIDNLEGGNSAEKQILEALRWLKLDWDEGPDVTGEFGPYRQSQRIQHYQTVAQQLVTQGTAYVEGNAVYFYQPQSTQAPITVTLIQPDSRVSPQFAAIVDQHLMSITHVVSKHSQIANEQLEVAIYNAMGWPTPTRVLFTTHRQYTKQTAGQT